MGAMMTLALLLCRASLVGAGVRRAQTAMYTRKRK
jgi:hypothetical protein